MLRRESSTLVNTVCTRALQERRIEKLCVWVCMRAPRGGDKERRRAGRRGTSSEGDIQSITNRSSRVHPTFLVVTVSVGKVGRVVRLRQHASLFPSYTFSTLSFSLSLSPSYFLTIHPCSRIPALGFSPPTFHSKVSFLSKKKRGEEWRMEIIVSSLSYRLLIRIFRFLFLYGHLYIVYSSYW